MKSSLLRLRTLASLTLILLAAGIAPAATNLTWNGSGARLWSTAGNWLPAGPPGASDTASFFNSATAPNATTVNNTVAANTQIASLVYGQSNNFPHVTRINPGVTLTVSSTNANLLFDGAAGDNGQDFMSTNLITGAGGTLVLNSLSSTTGNLNVRQWSGTSGLTLHRAVLDLSGLDNLNASLSRLLVAGDGTTANNRQAGTLYLARTNLIVAAWNGWTGTNLPAIGISDGTGGNGSGSSYLYLGQTNAIFADSISVAGFLGGEDTRMLFNPAFSNPAAYIRGNSATRVGTLAIADNSSAVAKSTKTVGTLDFTGGTVDAMVDTIWVARSEVSAGGNGARSTATLTFEAGTIDVNTMELGYQMGDPTVVYAANGTLNVNGSALLVVNSGMRLAHNKPSTVFPPPVPVGTLNLNGGTVRLKGGDIADGGGTSTVTVNSGLLDMQPLGRLSPGNISAGSITVGGGGTAVVTNAATITSASVTINSDGTIAGNTSFNLGTNGTFSSPGFTLRGQFSGGGTVGGDFTQNSGAVLNPGGSGAPGTLAFGGNLTFNGGSLLYDLSNDPVAGTNDLITVAGTLNLVGTNTVFINAISGSLPNATYPLITCGSLNGDATRFQVSGAAGQSRHTYTFSTTPTAINLTLGGSDAASLLWAGDGSLNTWNVLGASNWKNGAASSQFYNLDTATFDDTGSATPAVNVVGTVIPGAITVNNSTKDYIFSGSGNISGGASLTKQGTRALTLAGTGTNSFNGPITVGGGTLTLSSSGVANLPGSVTVAAGGALTVAGSGVVTLSAGLNLDPGSTLTYNRSDTVACAGALTGGGSFVQQGTGVLILTADNSFFDGPILVNAGTLQAGSATALGSINGSTTVASGATLDVNGFNLGAEAVTVSGAGVGGNGVIINNGFAQVDALQNVTLAADATFGGAGNWGIRSEPTTSITTTLSTGGLARKLIKVGGNQVSLTSVNVDPALGNIELRGGTLSLESLTTGLGNPASTLTLFTNATLQLLAFSQTMGDPSQSITLNKPIAMNDGSSILNAGGLNVILSPITLVSGTNTISVTASNKFGTGSGAVSYSTSLTVNNVISGVGSLAKSGGGTLYLSAANTFSGRTSVSGGTLALLGSGSIAGSTNISLSSGATLDASGRTDGTLTVTSGQTLSGSGTVNGSLTANANATVAPGGTARTGTLTVTNGAAVTLAGTITMKLDQANHTNDVLRTSGSITYGGTLAATGLGGTYAPGQTFKLFDAASYNPSSFGTLSLPVGVTWDTSKLAVDGTIKVVSVAPPLFGGISSSTNGAFRLSLTGPAGESYRIWANTNAAATPVTNTWTLLVTNGQFGVTGAATFLDTAATNYPKRFYLISVP